MNKRRFALLAFLCLVFGCSTTRTIRFADADSFNQANNFSKNKKAQITLEDGRHFDARNLLLGIDSTSWINSKTELSQTAATKDIHEIRFSNRPKGAAIGFFGVALPFGISVLLANSGDSFFEPSTSDILKAATVYGLIGAGVGALVQFKTKYRFIDANPDASPSQAPPMQSQ